jgi:hypothetical protein
MAMDSQRERELRLLCEIAGQRADGRGPIARIRTANDGSGFVLPRRHGLWKAGIGAGLGALAIAVVAAQMLNAAPAVEVAAAPAPDIADLADDASTPPTLQPALVASTLPGPVRWQDGELKVDIDAEPLPQAIEQLAQATHSTVSGQQLLHDPTRVTLHWYAADAKTAWQLLLRDRAGFKVRCESAACEVHITNEIASPKSDSASSPHDSTPAAPASGEPQSQPDNSC